MHTQMCSTQLSCRGRLKTIDVPCGQNDCRHLIPKGQSSLEKESIPPRLALDALMAILIPSGVAGLTTCMSGPTFVEVALVAASLTLLLVA